MTDTRLEKLIQTMTEKDLNNLFEEFFLEDIEEDTVDNTE